MHVGIKVTDVSKKTPDWWTPIYGLVPLAIQTVLKSWYDDPIF